MEKLVTVKELWSLSTVLSKLLIPVICPLTGVPVVHLVRHGFHHLMKETSYTVWTPGD